jgi:hypothetical protein
VVTERVPSALGMTCIDLALARGWGHGPEQFLVMEEHPLIAALGSRGPLGRDDVVELLQGIADLPAAPLCDVNPRWPTAGAAVSSGLRPV